MIQDSRLKPMQMVHLLCAETKLFVGCARQTLKMLKQLVTWQIALHSWELKKSSTSKALLQEAKFELDLVITKLSSIGSQRSKLALNNWLDTYIVEARIHVLIQRGNQSAKSMCSAMMKLPVNGNTT